MKNLTLLILLLSSYSVLPQDILMQNGTISQCSGNFYDSGGRIGNYSDNQNFVLTLCPEDLGQLVELAFSAFNTQASDILSIYDGDSPNPANLIGSFSGGPSNSPGIVRATSGNPTGCLTLEFVSDGSEIALGWAAKISCYSPCQTITSQLDSASPPPNVEGFIRVCPNESITLSGSGIFSKDGTGATYEWDLGDGNTITGQDATFSYSLPGVYIVNLNINDANVSSANPRGCSNRNFINQVVHVATIPDFTETKASESVLCYEETTTIEGVVRPTQYIKDCTPPESGLTFLPDGNVGESYETAIIVDCYDSTQVLSDINQLVNICITIEHSYLGDLFIDIVSPNGQTVRMHNRGGDSANLGIPWADGAVDSSANIQPGVGYEYCFVPGNTNPTLVGGILNGGVFPNGNGPNTYNDVYVPAGNYSSVSPLTGLLGSPLNGEWRIRITDNEELDNGFIFAWGIEFDPSLQSPALSFTPVITSENWDSDPTITNITGKTITVNPLSAGTYCYTYRAMDDFGCEYVEQVCIEKLPEVINATPNDLLICNATVPPYNFDLTQNTPVVIEPAPVPTDLVVTYHETQIDANNDTAPIGSSDAYSGFDGQIIYVRIEYLNSGCYNTSSFILNIRFRPTMNIVPDMMTCDDTSNDGFALFDLSFQTPIILEGLTDTTLTYHLSQSDADMNLSPVSGSMENTSNPQKIFVRLQDDNSAKCFTTMDFDLIVNPLPSTIVPVTLEACDSDGTGSTEFTLANATSLVLNNQTGITVTYHTRLSEAESGTFSLLDVYTNTSNPQTLYVRLENDITGCYNTSTLQLMVNPLPVLNTDPSNIVLCDDINGGDMQEVFDLTSNDTYIFNGNTGVTSTFHSTFEDAKNGSNAITDPMVYTNTSTLQTIFVRVTQDLTGCYSIVDFDISVNPLPEVVPVSDYILCEVNTDGFAQFDLKRKDVEVLNGQSPTFYSVTYHASRNDADNLTGALVSSYTNTSNPQPIFIAITNALTGCSISTQSFNLEVDNGAEANVPSLPYTICDNIGDNDGRGQFDLTIQDVFVLGLQDSANFIVTYYTTQGDAEVGMNPIPYTYENISNPQIIYARVDNDTPGVAGMDSSICYAVSQLTLRVNLLPMFDLDDSYTLCVDTNGTEVLGLPMLNTGLSANIYTFEWSLDGTVLPDEIDSRLTAVQKGTYSVIVTRIDTGCANIDSAEIVSSSPPAVVVEVVTQAFSEDHVIIAMATGDGEYEYSLDYGPWQQSGTFENISFGEHTVTARDINGCGENSATVTVLDYPHFFTPNGDGRNETWNIVGFADQVGAKIYIFDRYGKLLKQISPAGFGWNGTFNGSPMPSSDYWFTVEYSEPSTGEQKQFRSHFTLKR